jgi:hypothetical protein
MKWPVKNGHSNRKKPAYHLLKKSNQFNALTAYSSSKTKRLVRLISMQLAVVRHASKGTVLPKYVLKKQRSRGCAMYVRIVFLQLGQMTCQP